MNSRYLIELLKQFPLRTDERRRIVSELLNKSTFFRRHLHPGYVVARCRMNPNKIRFNPSEMSYKPAHLCNTFQRASIINETRFYAASCEFRDHLHRPITDLYLGAIIAICETAPEFRCNQSILRCKFGKHESYYYFSNYSDFCIYGSVSFWEIVKDVDLVEVAPFEVINSEASRGRMMQMITKSYTNHYDPASLLIFNDLFSFLSYEFSKESICKSEPYDEIGLSYQYINSALASDIIVRDLHYDGVVYPSVKFDRKGHNIALSTDSTDRKLGYIFDVDFIVECKSNIIKFNFGRFGNEKSFLNKYTKKTYRNIFNMPFTTQISRLKVIDIMNERLRYRP